MPPIMPPLPPRQPGIEDGPSESEGVPYGQAPIKNLLALHVLRVENIAARLQRRSGNEGVPVR